MSQAPDVDRSWQRPGAEADWHAPPGSGPACRVRIVRMLGPDTWAIEGEHLPGPAWALADHLTPVASPPKQELVAVLADLGITHQAGYDPSNELRLAAEVLRLRGEVTSRIAAAVKHGSGAALIAAERDRQVTCEGYEPSLDDEHDSGELAWAGACYAVAACDGEVLKVELKQGWHDFRLKDPWPWREQDDKRRDPRSSRVRKLVKAGALLAAEVDRLLRAEARAKVAGSTRGGEA